MTNCSDIREMLGCRTDNVNPKGKPDMCRKVQLAHTITRMLYSNYYPTMLLALKMHKEYNIDPFYAIWVATKIYNAKGFVNPDYGYWYGRDSKIISTNDFIDNFFDDKLTNSVMKHFIPKISPLTEWISAAGGENNELYADLKVCTSLFGNNWVAHEMSSKIMDKNIGGKIHLLIEKALLNNEFHAEHVKFKFIKKLFNSVCIGPEYIGIVIPNNKLNRLIFKDENEIVLSVLRGSKFIQID